MGHRIWCNTIKQWLNPSLSGFLSSMSRLSSSVYLFFPFSSLLIDSTTSNTLLLFCRKHCILLRLSLLTVTRTFFVFPSRESLSPSLPSASPSVHLSLFLTLPLPFSSSTLQSLYLHLCLCELSTSSFFFNPPPPTHTQTSFHLSLKVPGHPCLCPFILLLHLPASPFITSSFHSSWCLSFSLIPVFLFLCDEIKAPSVSSFHIFLQHFWCIFSHCLVLTSFTCLFFLAFLYRFLSLPISFSSGERRWWWVVVVSVCRVMVLWLCHHWLNQQLNIDTVEAQHLYQAGRRDGWVDRHTYKHTQV